jgi:ankyrin repeat protein
MKKIILLLSLGVHALNRCSLPISQEVHHTRDENITLEILRTFDRDKLNSNWDGWSLLHIYSSRNKNDLCRYLLEQGAAVDGADFKEGLTPLHIAAGQGNLDLCKILLNAGASRDLSCRNNKTAAQYASEAGHAYIAYFLNSHTVGTSYDESSSDDYLQYKIIDNHDALRIFKELIERNLLVLDAPDPKGFTLMALAFMKEKFDLCTLFLEQLASLKTVTHSGQTLFHLLSCDSTNREVCRELCERALFHGLSLNAQDGEGFTPLHRAAQSKGELECELLLALGAELERLSNGLTPFQVAVLSGNINNVKFLHSRGASPNRPFKGGVLPINLVASQFFVFDKSIKENFYGCPEKWDEVEIDKNFLSEIDLVKIVSNLPQTRIDTLELLTECEEIPKKSRRQENRITLLRKSIDRVLQNYSIESTGEGCLLNLLTLLSFREIDISKSFVGGATLLHEASYFGSLFLCRLLLKRGAFANARDNAYRTPLHWACLDNGNELCNTLCSCSYICRELIKNGAEVDAQDDCGLTPLHYVVLNPAHVELCETFIARKASVSLKDKKGRTALFLASSRGNLPASSVLIDLGASCNEGNNKGITPLHKASIKGDVRCCKLLLASGAKINALDKMKKKALHYGAAAGQTGVIKFLLSSGASSDVKDFQGITPCVEAASGDHDEVVALFLNHTSLINEDDIRKSLLIAAEKGFLKTAKLLRSAFKSSDNFLETALHKAARGGHTQLCELLVQSGADLEAQNIEGKTPLHIALEQKKYAVVQLLGNEGSRLDISDIKKRIPLHYACINGDKEGLQLILKDYKYLFNLDSEELTPLHYLYALSDQNQKDYLLKFLEEFLHREGSLLHCAVSRDSVSGTSLLLEKGYPVGIKDSYGDTPLHKAAERGSVDLCRMLLEKGASLHERNTQGETALHSACRQEKSSHDTIELLLKHGAPILAQDVWGLTPFMRAVQMGNQEKAQMLLTQSPFVLSQKDIKGRTVLHYAVEAQRDSLCRFLISYDKENDDAALVNSQESEGVTPLMLAVMKNSKAIVEILLNDKNIILERRDARGRSALSYAVEGSNDTLCTLLLDRGCSPTALTKDKKTILFHACAQKNYALCKELLSKNADVTISTADGMTPLHEVSRLGDASLGRMLLEKGIGKGLNVNAKTERFQRTPLHYAVDSHNVDLVKILVEFGANPMAPDSEGVTPLLAATKKQHLEICTVLIPFVQRDFFVQRTEQYIRAAQNNRKILKLFQSLTGFILGEDELEKALSEFPLEQNHEKQKSSTDHSSTASTYRPLMMDTQSYDGESRNEIEEALNDLPRIHDGPQENSSDQSHYGELDL